MIRKILVTGANGQLGYELKKLAQANPERAFYFTDLPELDISDEASIRQFLTVNPQQLIINCAAYTAVDKAEQEPDKAFLINAESVKLLSGICAEKNTGFIHVSTDFVFNGRQSVPYQESDTPEPLSVYARSKSEGEKYALQAGTVIRTAWLYSAHGNNFVKTILRLASERKELRVVFDQTGTPTWAFDLANCILGILNISDKNQELPPREIFHFTNEGVCSWYDFAWEIIRISGLPCKLYPIESKEYPVPAKRPSYSVLNKQKIRNYLNQPIPYWKESLIKCMAELGQDHQIK